MHCQSMEDATLLFCVLPNKQWEILEKENKINEKYRIPKRWRAEKEKEYFFVTGTNEITADEEYYNKADNVRYELGNYFKTEEEAEKVKEELDKFWAKVREWEIGDD